MPDTSSTSETSMFLDPFFGGAGPPGDVRTRLSEKPHEGGLEISISAVA